MFELEQTCEIEVAILFLILVIRYNNNSSGI